MQQLIEEISKRESGTPASEEAIAEAEQNIGYSFPPLILQIYSEVANGGIGPGYQILGVKGGHTSDEGDSISELYLALYDKDPEDPEWQWPKGIVPFCHWGCAIYSCFDASKADFPVFWFDPNMRELGEPMEQQFIPHRDSLESWFQGWVNGDDLWAETYGI
ncbi:MAG: SMI1/KNR4 family protein [bacterium]